MNVDCVQLQEIYVGPCMPIQIFLTRHDIKERVLILVYSNSFGIACHTKIHECMRRPGQQKNYFEGLDQKRYFLNGGHHTKIIFDGQTQ